MNCTPNVRDKYLTFGGVFLCQSILTKKNHKLF